MSKKIKVSKNPNENWDNNHFQFARFISEAEAVGIFDNHLFLKDMADTMDLTEDDVLEIIDRAQKDWGIIKEATK